MKPPVVSCLICCNDLPLARQTSALIKTCYFCWLILLAYFRAADKVPA